MEDDVREQNKQEEKTAGMAAEKSDVGKIAFDSIVTEKALNDFKAYHNIHTIAGVFGYMFSVFAIAMCVIGIKYDMSDKYVTMMGLFGVFFLVYPTLSSRLSSKRQMKTMQVFQAPMHYSVGEDKIVVSQGETVEELPWECIFKVRFTGTNLILYLSAVRANVLTVDSMGDKAVAFAEICARKLEPFQIKVNMAKLKKAARKASVRS